MPDRLTWWDTTWRVLVALLLGGSSWLLTAAMIFPEDGGDPPLLRGTWFVIGDPLLGLVATVLMLWRRRWPVPVTVVTTLLTGVSMVATGPQTIALVSLTTRRRWREIVPVTALTVAVSLLATRVVYPESQPLPLWAETLMTLLVIAVIVAIGYAIGSRRALIASWVERARVAESEQSARVAQAQTAERSRIAREMHDVLAHRISLITMHSGLLVYRADLPESERRDAITAIDANARAALTDLREVLGVLRDDGEGVPLRPQSRLQDLPELLDEARATGTRVTFDGGGLDLHEVPETIGRTAFRVVQEGLTNARKHAPGAGVEVRLTGAPGAGLDISVTNPRSVQTAHAEVPGTGTGLLGLSERVDLAGGRIEHGWTPEGRHRLAVWLPWPT
ncbi:hypothetical protein ASJ30_08785 [Janibacter indicus]|uniref:histidine kinase n=1 Tax=Janibacter indicus TaxID=857417 RepID=A0A1L3ML28_9MICO|nr:hypothetical protein ASJ30_08785 [Janibacter indicus]